MLVKVENPFTFSKEVFSPILRPPPMLVKADTPSIFVKTALLAKNSPTTLVKADKTMCLNGLWKYGQVESIREK